MVESVRALIYLIVNPKTGAFITAAHTAQAGMDICAAYVDDLAGMTCRFRTPYKRIDKEFRRAVFIRTSH